MSSENDAGVGSRTDTISSSIKKRDSMENVTKPLLNQKDNQTTNFQKKPSYTGSKIYRASPGSDFAPPLTDKPTNSSFENVSALSSNQTSFKKAGPISHPKHQATKKKPMVIKKNMPKSKSGNFPRYSKERA